jgi:hypothetical protein
VEIDGRRERGKLSDPVLMFVFSLSFVVQNIDFATHKQTDAQKKKKSEVAQSPFSKSQLAAAFSSLSQAKYAWSTMPRSNPIASNRSIAAFSSGVT